MNYQAFDQFSFDDIALEEESPDIEESTPEKANTSDKDKKKESIGYYTHSLKPSVKKTILTGDDFVPMARTKIELANTKGTVGNGKKTSTKNHPKEKKQSKSKITKENQDQKGRNPSSKVRSTKETTTKKSSATKAIKTSKSQPIDILHNIVDNNTKIKPNKAQKIVAKKTQSKIKSLGKKNQIEKNLERQLKTTLEALVQTTLNRFLKLK